MIVLLKKTSSLPIGNDIIQVFLFSKDKTPSISKSLKFHNIFQSGMVLQVKTENHTIRRLGWRRDSGDMVDLTPVLFSIFNARAQAGRCVT